MINTYFLLFYEFFKIGLFAVGGGYATIPFLVHLTHVYDWFTFDELTNMIAISNITPGPIGINMATYAGYTTSSVTGSLISTFAIILAPFIITIFTIYFINKFRESSFLSCLFQALRPASCALLLYVMIELLKQNVFLNFDINIKAFVLLSILFLIYPFCKKNPSLIIVSGALLGIIFNSCNFF